jgi:peptidylprolyl isomerase
MTKTEVKKWDNVAVSYTGTLEDGTIFDATSKHWWEPLKFTVWAGQMIKGFDTWVIGMKVWETKSIKMWAVDAYWEYDKNRKQTMPLTVEDKKGFQNAWIELKVWETINTSQWQFSILEVKENELILDTNHPLAWKNLIFEVKMIEIK